MSLALAAAIGAFVMNGASDIFLKKSADSSEPFRTNILRTLACLFPALLIAAYAVHPDVSTSFWFLCVISGLLMAVAIHLSILALRREAVGLQLPIIRMAFLVTIGIEMFVEKRIPTGQELSAFTLAAIGIFLILGTSKVSE